jgi:hypothetical protein
MSWGIVIKISVHYIYHKNRLLRASIPFAILSITTFDDKLENYTTKVRNSISMRAGA